MWRIAVIGGGIAGLAAANRLLELSRDLDQPIEIRVFESAPRAGGSISTERMGDFLVEGGPDSFLSEKPWALALAQRLGLADQLIGTRDELRRTYVVCQGRLDPLPDGFLLLAPTRLWPLIVSPLFSWSGKLRMALDLVLPRGIERPDESLTSFVTRRLGREALERVAQPLVGGIYTADPDRLSLRATMPRFLEMERRHRSVILAMRRQRKQSTAVNQEAGSGARWSLFLSFKEGMQTLVDALVRRLPEGALALRTPVGSLRRSGTGDWAVNDGIFDAVIVAVPAYAAAELLEPVDVHLAHDLREIPYASAVTVTLAFRRESVAHPLNGFGFVVPRIEKRSLIACTFSSLKYAGRAPAEFVLLRAFVGGTLQEEVCAQDDTAIERTVRRELSELLNVYGEPVLRRIHRHPRAMPQYHVGHLDRVQRIERGVRELPGLALAGNAYRGVGIPDCVHMGERAAERVMRMLGRPGASE